jgi:hypothetical protein
MTNPQRLVFLFFIDISTLGIANRYLEIANRSKENTNSFFLFAISLEENASSTLEITNAYYLI